MPGGGRGKPRYKSNPVENMCINPLENVCINLGKRYVGNIMIVL